MDWIGIILMIFLVVVFNRLCVIVIGHSWLLK